MFLYFFSIFSPFSWSLKSCWWLWIICNVLIRRNTCSFHCMVCIVLNASPTYHWLAICWSFVFAHIFDPISCIINWKNIWFKFSQRSCNAHLLVIFYFPMYGHVILFTTLFALFKVFFKLKFLHVEDFYECIIDYSFLGISSLLFFAACYSRYPSY